MKDYNFLNLSPYEFEILSRDLLQEKLEIYLESFGNGADQGIDLRCSEGKNLIVQCKRYKDYSSLISNLKKEIPKVKKLQPNRYIICTSVSLLPKQKKAIIELFAPFIRNSSDLYGKEDLNNLLSKYPDIEKNFHKLWLSSTNILHEIINSQVVNQSRFIKDEINEKIKVYVQNESFTEALSILKGNNYVVISGIPGIGKTTLAEMLVFHLLGNGIEEFIYMSDTINNGFELFNEAKKQIFLFDDFLGRNFIYSNISTNEEKQILRFIKRVQNTSNKYLIFTTREYILNQARQRYEDLENTKFSKCILDLSKYPNIVRAKILYNHLYINKIPFEYVTEILNQDALFKIIGHKNYNPRIIESFTNSKLWDDISVKKFPDEVLRLFDNPYLVWKHVYENQISELGRIILDCLLITGESIEYHLLYQQVRKYTLANAESIKSVLNNYTFKASLKELENSLIKIHKNSDRSLSVSYQNPSIQDFIVNHISEETVSKKSLLGSILFINPALNLISNQKQSSQNKLSLTVEERMQVEQYCIDNFDELVFDSKSYSWSKPSEDDLEFLKLSKLNELESKSQILSEFIKRRYLNKIYSENITNKSIEDYISLFESFHSELELNISTILINISGAFWVYEDLYSLYTVKEIYPKEFQKFQEEKEDIYNDIFDHIVHELQNEESENIDTYQNNINILKELGEDFDYWIDDVIEDLQQKISELEVKENERNDLDEYDYFGVHVNYSGYHGRTELPRNDSENIEPRIFNSEKSEEELITDLFKSLE